MDRETDEIENVVDLDVFLRDLRKLINGYKRLYHSRKKDISRQHPTYDSIIQSQSTSKAFKGIASLSKIIDFAEQTRSAGDIVLLFSLQRLALNVMILENKLDNLSEQLVDSKIIEKAKDIDDIKEIKKLLVEQYKKREKQQKQMEETQKKMEESRREDLSYVG